MGRQTTTGKDPRAIGGNQTALQSPFASGLRDPIFSQGRDLARTFAQNCRIGVLGGSKTGDDTTMIHDQIVNLPVITTERLALRPLRKSDAGLLHHYAGDRRVAEATRSLPHPMPQGAMEAFIARELAGKGSQATWVMDGSISRQPEVLGLLWLTPMDRGQSEIAYWVAPAFWNTGLASEAVKALVHANPRGDKTCFAEVFQDNPASARVLTNAGFEYLGDAEAFSLARNAPVRTWTYSRKF